MTTPKLIDIKAGWLAVYDPKTKKVLGITEFKKDGQMTEGASYINTATRDELLLEMFKLGLTHN